MPRYRIIDTASHEALSEWTTDTKEVANLAQTTFAGRDVTLDVHRSNRRLIG